MRIPVVAVSAFVAALVGSAIGSALVARPEWFGFSWTTAADVNERRQGADGAQRRDEDERKRKLEEERRRYEEEARRKAEEEARRRAEDERKRAEDARRKEETRRDEGNARRPGDEDARRHVEEEVKRLEEERRRDQEALRRAEEELRRRDDEERRREAERRRAEEDRRRQGGTPSQATGVTCDYAAPNLKGAFASEADCYFAQRNLTLALTTARDGAEPTSWNNPKSGATGTIRVFYTTREADGTMCRRFEQSVTVNGRKALGVGTACFRNNTWQIVP